MTERPYQLLPPLDAEQRELLRQSIQENGVLEPVVFDEDGEILDGHHRVEIADELDIDYPRRVVDDLDEAGKRKYALTTNIARRQLTSASRASLVGQLRAGGMSIRQIAETTGLPKSTVSDDVRQLSESGQLNQPERITGKDGKDRPAARPALIDHPLSPASGEDDAAPSSGPGLELDDEPDAEPDEADPFAAWSEDELDLRKRLFEGETVVVSLRAHHANVVQWATEADRLVRVDRRTEWGNPFEMPADGDRDAVIRAYADYYLPNKPSLLGRVEELAGKALACWCAPAACHADVLKEATEQ